ncbi:MAG: manganese efflux pump MntP family protein [Campylobacteraceae bacterium]|jgi:putative Mn2+ efflux pump MntP|nr:manganese efflux pump MntP family protein [Campylobacteraceae bacterium]
MIELLLLAFALCMDAFAVSLGIGAKDKNIAFKAALYFGAFQGIMPLIGFMIGKGSAEYIASFDHWIAFSLLGFLGLKMIHESFKKDGNKENFRITHKTLLLLAIATSLDALAAGFTLIFLDSSLYVSIAVIVLVTFIFSFLGVKIGAKSGKWLGSAAEILGGIVLIGIGVKILIEHIG